jgi:hypothetical protein
VSSAADPGSRRRRSGTRGLDLWTLALAAAFVVVGIGLPLLGLKVFLGSDLLLTRPPWNATVPTGFRPQLPCVGDTVDYFMPGTRVFRGALADGDVAAWNPYAGGGAPLASVPTDAVLSPLSLPYFVLPLWMAPAFVKLLEMVVSIGGMVLFLRRVGVGRAGALLAGTVFTSSGFLVVWTNWPQTRVAAFVPALFWAIERVVQRRRLLDAVLVGVVVACMLLGGFPAVTGYALYAAGAYLLVRLVAERRRPAAPAVGTWRPTVTGLALGGLGVALGGALAAVQLLPFAGQLGTLNLEYREQTPDAHLPSFSLVTALVPSAYGTCDGGVYRGPMNPIEVIAFVGVTAALLAVVGVARRTGTDVRRGVRTFLVAGLAVVLVLGWIGGPLLAAAQQLPVFSNSSVGRIRVMFGFFAACLAGLGYDALVRRNGQRPAPWRRAAAVAVWVVAGLGVGWVGMNSVRYAEQRAALRPFASAAVLPAAAGLVALVLLGLAVSRRPAARRLALVALPALVLVESLAFVLPFWPRVDRSAFYPVTPTHRFLAEHLGSDRFDGAQLTLYPSTGQFYGLRSATGHSFLQPTWADLIRTVDPAAFASPTFTQFPARDLAATISSPVLDRLAVRYFATDPGAPLLGEAATLGGPARGTVTLADRQPVEVRVPAQALRGAGPVLAAPVPRPLSGLARLEVTVLDASGRPLVSSSRRLRSGVPAPGAYPVALAGEDLPTSGRLTVRLTLRARGSTLSLAARGGTPVLTVVRPRADGLRVAFADDGATVYQRLTSLPRIRWASATRVVPDPAARPAALARGVPGDTVLLDGPGPAAEGRPARVSVGEDSGDRVRTTVDAGGAGYLVVADALQSGWSATVDGAPAELRHADHGLVAVAVPAGRHEVELAYTPPGWPVGQVVSVLALLAAAALAGLDVLGRRRRRAPPSTPEPGPRPDPLVPTGAGRVPPDAGPAAGSTAGPVPGPAAGSTAGSSAGSTAGSSAGPAAGSTAPPGPGP